MINVLKLNSISLFNRNFDKIMDALLKHLDTKAETYKGKKLTFIVLEYESIDDFRKKLKEFLFEIKEFRQLNISKKLKDAGVEDIDDKRNFGIKFSSRFDIDTEDERYTNDLILVFKELIKQRIKGIRQEDGTYLNPNFPKILYFLDEDTMKGGKYYDITRMCAECSSKRLVPDYLSVRKHKELKGVPTPPMGK